MPHRGTGGTAYIYKYDFFIKTDKEKSHMVLLFVA
jgi:hypothetical protein